MISTVSNFNMMPSTDSPPKNKKQFAEVAYVDVDPQDAEATPGKGPLPADFIIVGIAPSPKRTQQTRNEPFGAKSYELIQALRGNYPSLYVTNLKKTTQPLGKKVGVKEQRKWAPLLYHELSLAVKCGVSRILTLGTEPAQVLCPGFRKLREDHGTVFYNPELDVQVIPTFHFAAAMRNPEMKPLLKNDINRFFEGDFANAAEFVLDYPKIPLGDEVYLDIETTGTELYTNSIISIGFADQTSPVYIIQEPTQRDYERLWKSLKKKVLIGHNFPFDLTFLEEQSGLPWTTLKVKDTMLAPYVLGESILSLKHLTTQYTKRPGSHGAGSFEDPEYLAEDVVGTREVAEYFFPRAEKQWITHLLWDMAPKIARMRLYGVHIDWKLAEKLKKPYLQKIAQAEKVLRSHRAFKDVNLNAAAQVGEALHVAGVPLTERTEKGQWATSEAALAPFRGQGIDIVDHFFLYKDTVHELGFILEYEAKRGPDYRLHPKFNLTGASTGRSSMNDPNLQQVPRVGPLKLMFISRFLRGLFGLIDLSQAELRVAALLSGDEYLAWMLDNVDVHRQLASIGYGIPYDEVPARLRKRSKGVTFGRLYGGGLAGLAKRTGMELREAQALDDALFSSCPKLKAYIQDQRDLAVATGQSTTPLGRIRDLRMLIEIEGENSAMRKGINSPIQGTANDIAFVILNYVMNRCIENGLQSFPIFGVHDSSAHDVHPDEKEQMIQFVREGFWALNDTPLAQLPLWGQVPIIGEFILGPNWASVESTNEENYKPLESHPCSNME
jgi:uracil-DNA glycosylase family 4